MVTRTYNHQQQQKNYRRNGKPTAAASSSTNNKLFLPILCRVSVKDSIIAHHSSSTIRSRKDDPSSPRVTCTGQVKRHHTHDNTFRLLIPSSTTTVKHPNIGNTTQKIMRQRRITKFKAATINDNSATIVPLNLAELDPPLPVIKELLKSSYSGVNIWKRRSRGNALAYLQIPRFQCTRAAAAPLQIRPPTCI